MIVTGIILYTIALFYRLTEDAKEKLVICYVCLEEVENPIWFHYNRESVAVCRGPCGYAYYNRLYT